MITINRLQNYFRARMRRGHQTLNIPNFQVFVEACDGGNGMNVAVPEVPEVRDLSESQAAMQSFISDMRCPISVSFLEEYAPLLPDALLKAGWIASHHVPVMHCAPGDLVEAANLKGLSISILNCDTPLEEIKVAMDVNAAGFAPDAEPTTDDEAFDFRENLGGGKVFLARYEGKPAATGMYAEMVDGIAEPLGITTLPAFRNLGIGVFMVGAMTRSAYVDGATWVIAQAFTPIIENIYLQVGYQRIATQVIYRLPELVSG